MKQATTTLVALALVFLLQAQEATTPIVQRVQQLLDQERFEEASSTIQSALLTNAGASNLHRIHGDLLFRQGHIPEAGSEYQSAAQLDPHNAAAREGESRVFEVTGFRAKAAALSSAPIEPDHDWELASPYQHYDLPGHVLLKGGRITGMSLPITISGVSTDLRLDTGAGGVSVSSAFAAKAGLRRLHSSKGWGIGNNAPVDTWTGSADQLSIGALKFTNATIAVSPKGALDISGGLVGTDIFKRFLVTLDFARQRVKLDPLPGPPWDGKAPVDKYEGPETKSFTGVVQVYHYLLVPTRVNGQESLFLIDTGATFNSISTRLARAVAIVRTNHHMSIKGVSGKVNALYEADQVMLLFAGFQQPVTNLAAFDLSNISRSAGIEVGGILGLPELSQFRSITIDYRDEAVAFILKPPAP